MSYSLDELVAKFRREMDDTIEPYLWSTDEITDYLDEAEDEFAQEVDVITEEISISFTASETFSTLPSYVTRLRRAENSDGKTMELYNTEEWAMRQFKDDYGLTAPSSDWRTKTGANVTELITDMESGKVRLYPIPEANGTFTAHVYRRPVEPLAERNELEVTDRQHQRCILLKARALAYNKHDAETYNPTMADEMERSFLTKVSEITSRVARTRRRAGTTQYGGL